MSIYDIVENMRKFAAEILFTNPRISEQISEYADQIEECDLFVDLTESWDDDVEEEYPHEYELDEEDE